MATGAKTGGRRKGTPNKKTAALTKAIQEATARYKSTDAHDLLIYVYQDTSLPLNLRIEAAGRALPYEKPRLGSVEVGGSDKAIRHTFEWISEPKPAGS